MELLVAGMRDSVTRHGLMASLDQDAGQDLASAPGTVSTTTEGPLAVGSIGAVPEPTLEPDTDILAMLMPAHIDAPAPTSENVIGFEEESDDDDLFGTTPSLVTAPTPMAATAPEPTQPAVPASTTAGDDDDIDLDMFGAGASVRLTTVNFAAAIEGDSD